MSKASERKARLHVDLIDAAERRTAELGVTRLRARDLAADVGCSLGAIYNVFDDLHELVLHVNLRTLEGIDKTMSEANTNGSGDPAHQLVQLAWAYFEFAEQNTKPWRGLFDHTFPDDYDLPDWVVQGQISLLVHIEKPLLELLPTATPYQLTSIARMLFAAVHGIVELSLDDRTVGLEATEIRDHLKLLIEAFIAGYPAIGPATLVK